MEFLHERDIVHGELCDVSCQPAAGPVGLSLTPFTHQKNILINRDGKAVVCGFDLFRISNVRGPSSVPLSKTKIYDL